MVRLSVRAQALLLSLSSTALCANRIIIDGISCTGDTWRELHDGAQTAVRWAQDAGGQLLAPEDQRDGKINEVIQWILGSNPDDVNKVAVNMMNIGALAVQNDEGVDAKAEMRNGAYDWDDVIIVCDDSHLETHRSQADTSIRWRNIFTNTGEERNGMTKQVAAGKLSNIEAFTSRHPGHSLQENAASEAVKKTASVILFNPYSINKWQKKGWPKFGLDLIKKAADPKLGNKIAKAFENFSQLSTGFGSSDRQLYSYIDAVATHELTLLHELTHTRLGGLTLDTPEGRSYMWRNIIAAQDANNADSLAYLAMVIQMITNHNYEPTKDGKVYQRGTPAPTKRGWRG